MKKIYFIAIALLTMSSTVTASNLVVIASIENTENIDINDVSRIFLGKVTQYPSGKEVTPLTPHPRDPSYEHFTRVVLKKNVSQLRAYWAKRVFTGKGRPPRVIENSDDLKELVKSDTKYLSYIDRNNIEHEVRWMLEINDSGAATAD